VASRGEWITWRRELGVTLTAVQGFSDKVGFIWSVADLLRGDFRAHEYGQVILPFTVLRRLECALAPTKAGVLRRSESLRGKVENVDPILQRTARHRFYNVSPLDLASVLADPGNVAPNLRQYLAGFSPGAQEVLERYGFPDKISRLDKADLLYQVVAKFAEVDLSEQAVPNEAMGYIFEELLRRFNEMSNETAGEHFTPREVIRLMVNLLFCEDEKALAGVKPVRTMYDPACGTGGMLTVSQNHLRELNPDAVLEVYGQELNAESWAVCRSDMMIKDDDPAASRSATRSPTTTTRAHGSTTCSPTRPLAWTGRSTPTRSRPNTRSSVTTAGSAPDCPGCRTGRCCSSCTCSTR